ncbi:unnamed protein product [Prunus brigantina]
MHLENRVPSTVEFVCLETGQRPTTNNTDITIILTQGTFSVQVHGVPDFCMTIAVAKAIGSLVGEEMGLGDETGSGLVRVLVANLGDLPSMTRMIQGRRRAGSVENDKHKGSSFILCAFPAGVSFYSSGSDSNGACTIPRSNPIVLTEGDGTKIYVSCIAFRDPVSEDIAEAYCVPANSFADKFICLVSPSPSFRLLRNTLEELFSSEVDAQQHSLILLIYMCWLNNIYHGLLYVLYGYQIKDGLYSLPEQYPEGVNKPWGEDHDLQPRLVFLKFFASLLISAAHVFNTQAFLTMWSQSIGQTPEPMLTHFLDSHVLWIIWKED